MLSDAVQEKSKRGKKIARESQIIFLAGNILICNTDTQKKITNDNVQV
jgi:hypothetical protein